MPELPLKRDLLQNVVRHLDIKKVDVVPLVDMMADTAFSARDLARAGRIFDRMIRDADGGVILTLAGSVVSAGQRQVVVDLLRSNMVDAIVSTGANVVDQDFFEALGFCHYQGDKFANDATLRELMIDRIYDTYIDEEQLRACDETVRTIAEGMSRARTPAVSSCARWGGTSSSTAWARTASSGPPSSSTCRSSCRRSATARQVSGWWPIRCSTPTATCRSIR